MKVELIESWGSDERIIEAARMSTKKGFLGWPQDEKLLAYLYNNKHTSPFEMAGMVLEVMAPISVFRQWQRHRTQSYNEMSGRYTEMDLGFYLPSKERIMLRDDGNKQTGGKGTPISEKGSEVFQGAMRDAMEQANKVYRMGLELGVSREVARGVLPLNTYSRMRCSTNLHNWLHFLRLRQAPDAQLEIRELADQVAEHVKTLFPRTYRLFCNK